MNVKIAGRAVVITSVDAEAIERLSKFQPDSLIMKDEDKNPIFKVSLGKAASLTQFGATFNDKTPDGKASMTLMLPSEVTTEGRQKFVEENFAPALWKLQVMEAHIVSEFTNLAGSFGRISSSITVE